MLRQVRNLKKESTGAAQAGFTIIEVMIVLAVAGLIMAIVFLAVPALQRNSRNTQRNSDANRDLAAIGECLSAKNGQITSCDTLAEISPTYVNTATNQQLTTVTIATGAPATPANNSTLNIGFTVKCNDSGDATVAAGTRAYVALYQLESNGGTAPTRCIAS